MTDVWEIQLEYYQNVFFYQAFSILCQHKPFFFVTSSVSIIKKNIDSYLALLQSKNCQFNIRATKQSKMNQAQYFYVKIMYNLLI